MPLTGLRHIPCGEPVNRSERLAIEKLKTTLQGVPGPWILLSNINHALHPAARADEIDIVIIGPPGVFVIEVKHWDSGYLKQNAHVAEFEAVRVDEKAKRVAGKIRQRFNPGFVAARLLLTRANVSWPPTQRPQIRGVEAYGLTEWREMLCVDRRGRLEADQIAQAANILEPRARVALAGELRSFVGLINLERISSLQDAFHRVYRGQHPTRRDKVVLHLYDLSASDDKQAKAIAEREYDVIQRWQKSPYLPSLLDSFQEAEHYPGELYYFSLVDPAAPTVAERCQDPGWSFDDRLRFARDALRALETFHHPSDESVPHIVHRHITPKTLRVRHNGVPLFTDFSLSRLSDAPTISESVIAADEDEAYLAPEVCTDGLAAADARSDVFSLCATLKTLFPGDNARSSEARDFLDLGCAHNPEGRESLTDLAEVFERHTDPTVTLEPSPTLPAPEYWDEDTVVPFQNSHYKIVGRLGRGGLGQTFKVVEVDAESQELFGTYVGKVIQHREDAEPALHAYRKVRAYTVHPHLSTIHEIAREWRPDQFVSLLKWVEGTPMIDLRGVVRLYAEELGELSAELMIIRWLADLCDALSQLHNVGLVHGDVSPRNIIVQGGEVVLTDYDTVTDAGAKPRSRNVVYASHEVDSGVEIRPRDDVFSLAASIFHVLVDRDPFLFGSERRKNGGLNWEGVDTMGLEKAAAFLKRATSNITSERFSDAAEARSFLAPLLEPPTVIAPSPTLEQMVAPWLSDLLTAYPGSLHGNAETRGLDSPFAAATYVETRLDEALRQEIAAGNVDLVILFGNAGDGKTAFLQHLGRKLGAEGVQSSHRLWNHKLSNGKTLRVNLDGSASWQGKSANEILNDFFEPYYRADSNENRRETRIVAINSGKLLEWVDSVEETSFTEKLSRALFDDVSQGLDARFRLIDLNRRSLVGGLDSVGAGITTDFLNRLLERFLGAGRGDDPWAVCPRCTAQNRCAAWQSVQVLRDTQRGPRVRARLADALQACHLRGEIHITARELRAALAFVFFGVHRCEELHQNPDLIPAPYWDRAFDASAEQRQGELLSELVRFDPALESHPLIDRQLLKVTPHGANDSAPALASARRRAYFEWDENELAALSLPANALWLAGGRHLDRFRRVPLMSASEREALCRELCLGIARLEDLPEVAFTKSPGLPLRIAPRTPTESAYWVVKPWERFSLSAPPAQSAEGLEALHTHIVLSYQYGSGGGERLLIGLELFDLLLGLKDGVQLSGTGQEGIFAHLEIFTQRLAQEDARELYGWHPAEEDRIYILHVKTKEGRQVLTRELV